MSWIFSAILLAGAWIAVGVLWKTVATQPVKSSALRRSVSPQVAAVGQEVEVTLTVTPRFEPGDLLDCDVLLLVDHSGSMGSGPASWMAAAKEAVRAFCSRCPQEIRVGVIAFNHEARRLAPLGAAARAAAQLDGLLSDGGTNLDLALDRAQAVLVEEGRPGVAPIVVVISDGFSDEAAAMASAQALRGAVPGVDICAVGLGSGVNQELLARLAGDDERILHLDQPEDFDRFVEFLVPRLPGKLALTAVVEEDALVREPLKLGATQPSASAEALGGDGEGLRLRWSLPVFDRQPIRFTYRLTARCPGWYRVAEGLRVTWSMPGGEQRSVRLGGGPWVWVLPAGLTWSWPFLHPWIGRLMARRCMSPPAVARDEEEAPPPGDLELPAALPVIPGTAASPAASPALVVGLGAEGEAALCQLRHRLLDRGVSEEQIALRLVDLESWNRAPVEYGGVALSPTERCSLEKDLYTYLDSLRRKGVPAARAWVPVSEWLSSARPATSWAVPDRRRARLTALLESDRLLASLRPAVRSAMEREATVYIVASLDDPVASGLLGEVSHLVAAEGCGVTLVLTLGADPRAEDRAALSRELGRWLALRGEAVESDRDEPPVKARRIVDRLVTLETPHPGEGRALAEGLYALLICPQLDAHIPVVSAEAPDVEVHRLRLQAGAGPGELLWRWVRDRALVRKVLLGWLDWDLKGAAAKVPDGSEVDLWSARFWSGEQGRRRAGILLHLGRRILDGEPAEAALLDKIPDLAPSHEQRDFHRGARRRLVLYFSDWSERLLASERAEGRWGLPLCLAVLRRLEVEHTQLVTVCERLAGREGLESLGRLATDLFHDQRLQIRAWIQQVRRYQDSWVGPGGSVATRLVERWVQSERALAAMVDLDEVRGAADEWTARHGEALVQRLGFQFATGGRGDGEGLSLALWFGDQRLEVDQSIDEALDGALEPYRGALEVSGAEPDLAPLAWRPMLRWGGLSPSLFPEVVEELECDDPAYGAAGVIDSLPLDRALGVPPNPGKPLPFVWPAEANAERLAGWLRQPPSQREPFPWSARVVHLLSRPERLRSVFAELESGRLALRGGQWCVERAGRWYPVAEHREGLGADEALVQFESMVRRMVSGERSLAGELLPEPAAESWAPRTEEAVARIETHPAVVRAARAEGWQAWRDIIESLTLEVAALD